MYDTDHIQMYVPFNSRGEEIELSQMKKSLTFNSCMKKTMVNVTFWANGHMIKKVSCSKKNLLFMSLPFKNETLAQHLTFTMVFDSVLNYDSNTNIGKRRTTPDPSPIMSWCEII